MSRHGASNFQKSRTLNDKYLLGDEIGKGAYGRVHKGVDLQNGDFVAIKQVSLENIPQEDLSSIMSEIDLLKNLSHKNIVKYQGSFKTKTDLYIILEFVENGSLASIVKPNKFGAFPESLVAIYIAQVLEGLVYLHEQGVIHRDIKGANILTTKEGLVKLADFGVATKLNEADGNALSVVGTPYWMAPEVIEMSGVTALADIWSVGCTVIELMTCVPPYYDLQPMPALFRIVQDDMPPIPDNLSPALTDFLHQCFRKDPKLRPDAATLLHHPWILNSRRALQTSMQKSGGRISNVPADVSTVVERTIEDAQQLEEAGQATKSSGRSGGGGSLARTTSDFNEQDGVWLRRHNFDAESTSGTSGVGTETSFRAPFPRSFSEDGQRPEHRRGRSNPEEEEEQAAEMEPPSVSVDHRGHSTSRPSHLVNRTKTEVGPRSRSPHRAPGGGVTFQRNGPLYSEFGPGDSHAMGRSPESGFQARRGSRTASRRENRRYDGRELVSEREGEEQLVAVLRRDDSHMDAAVLDPLQGRGVKEDLWRYQDSDNDAHLEEMFEDEPVTRRGSRSNPSLPIRLRAKLARRREASSPASKHREEDRLAALLGPVDADMADLDAMEGGILGRDALAKHSAEVARLLAELRPQKSEEQILNACKQLIQLARELAQHKAQLLGQQGVISLMEMLDGDNPKVLLAVLMVMNEMMKANVAFQESLGRIGLIPTVLAFASAERSRPEIRMQAAMFVHQMCHGSTLTLQMLIACRGLPVLVGFLEPDISKHRELVYMALDSVWRVLELQSPTPRTDFCRLFAKSGLLLRLVNTMHGLCGAARGPGDLRDWEREGEAYGSRWRQPNDPGMGGEMDYASTSYAEEGGESGPMGGMHMRTNASTPGRRLSRSKSTTLSPYADSPGGSTALSPMYGGRSGELHPVPSSSSAAAGMDRPDPDTVYLDKAAGLLLEMARADEVVKAQFCTQSLLKRLLDLLDRLDLGILLKVLKCVKQLAMDPNCLEPLQRADAIKKLVPFLELREGPLVTEIHIQVLSALFPLCKINKRRQELAAEAGIIPPLMELIGSDSPLKQFGLPLLCDMAHASRTTREALRQHGGLELYLSLLQDEFWAPAALDSLAVCLAHDNERRQVEQLLLRRDSLERLVTFFRSCTGPTFVHILEPFLKMMTKSVRLNAALGVSGLTPLLVSRLDHPDPIARLNLLKMIKAVYEHHPRPKQLIVEHDLPRKLHRLTEERRDGERSGGQVLVKQMASVLLKGLHVNTVL